MILASWAWLAFAGVHFKRNWNKYAQMFAPEPKIDLWTRVKKHNELMYCAECDPPPAPTPGELMYCPKCDNQMVPERTMGDNRDDWFCRRCQEAWVGGSARKYQSPYYRNAVAAATQAVNAGMSQGMQNAAQNVGGWDRFRTYYPLPLGPGGFARAMFDTGTPRKIHPPIGDFVDGEKR